ncbi:hypothetical protein B9J78_05055 [bacterium Unc6]|nr:hypothetical protein [bacterium Unc6]
MITEIGITAGEIWHYLDQHGRAKLSALIKGIERQKELVLMSVGWLAREGHVIVEGTLECDFEIYLRQQ